MSHSVYSGRCGSVRDTCLLSFGSHLQVCWLIFTWLSWLTSEDICFSRVSGHHSSVSCGNVAHKPPAELWSSIHAGLLFILGAGTRRICMFKTKAFLIKPLAWPVEDLKKLKYLLILQDAAFDETEEVDWEQKGRGLQAPQLPLLAKTCTDVASGAANINNEL